MTRTTPSHSPSFTPLWTLIAAEARRTFGLRHLLTLAGLIAMGVLLAIWLPMFPESIYRFFQRVFALPGWADIVFANGLTGLFFFLYWLGVFDVLAIYVLPYEERSLDLLLSKPVTRSTYMLTRLAPVMALIQGIGALGAFALWLAMTAVGLEYPPAAFVGASVATLAWVAFLVALVNLLILSVRDSFSAVAVAFAPMFAALLPSMLFMYRPDVLEHLGAWRDPLVFPMNLVWHKDVAARHGGTIAVVMLALACFAAALAGRALDRRDVR